MSSAIAGLKPEGVWKSFAEIAKIPRCSKNEAAISQFILTSARQLGLSGKVDAVGNVIVRKPALPGRETLPMVCLQGHLDMVCEKNADRTHDFLKDPIEIMRRDNCLMANGTTLGADNGIAVATNLAIMNDKSLEHGPLELLFTVDEETGLTGANNLPPDFIESRILINLDSEDEGVLFVGCAGGQDTTATWKIVFEKAPAKAKAIQVKVNGLKGGHSGLEIDKGRGNAIKILNRVLVRLTNLGARLESINAGSKRNVIPREAEATLFIPEKHLEEAYAAIEQMAAILKAEASSTDPELAIRARIVERRRRGKVIKKSIHKKVLQTITALPHGVIKMSPDLAGLVQTSTNLAIIKTTSKAIQLATSQRSSLASEIDDIADVVRTVCEMGGAVTKSSQGYPGWKPNINSQILQIAKSSYLSLFGKEPEVRAIHAGLECGIIGEKYPGMDMISFGPTLADVHTPNERIYIDTVEKYWALLLAILKNLR